MAIADTKHFEKHKSFLMSQKRSDLHALTKESGLEMDKIFGKPKKNIRIFEKIPKFNILYVIRNLKKIISLLYLLHNALKQVEILKDAIIDDVSDEET